MMFLGGCVTFHDLYFERNDLADVYLGQYRVGLRIFAHQRKPVPASGSGSGDFHVSVQVVSPQRRNDPEAWTQDLVQVSLRADQFLKTVWAECGVDSLVFHSVVGESDRVMFVHDGENWVEDVYPG